MFYIPFVYNNHVIKVGNISENTTCAQIVAAAKLHNRSRARSKQQRQEHLASKLRTGGSEQEQEYGVYEAYGGVERLLPPHTRIMGVWRSWKRRADDVTFSIKPIPAFVTRERHVVNVKNQNYWQINDNEPAQVRGKNWGQRGTKFNCRDQLAAEDRNCHIYTTTINKLTRIVQQQTRQLHSQQRQLTSLDLYIESASLALKSPADHCWDYSDDEAVSHCYWFDDDNRQTALIERLNCEEKDRLELYECIVHVLDDLIEQEQQINILLGQLKKPNFIITGRPKPNRKLFDIQAACLC